MTKLRELVESVNTWATERGQEPAILIEEGKTVEMMLVEGLPTSYGKERNRQDKVRQVVADIHARVIAAMTGEPLLGATPLPKVTDLEEARRKAKEPVELPDGIHQKLFR
jgi:hypothetical protein